MIYQYDNHFLDYAANTSDYSAKRTIEALQVLGPIGSVLDVGCARGTWLRAWTQAGVRDICGVDGEYANTAALLIDRCHFISADLTAGFDLARQFDLVQSLEVAEHLPKTASATLVSSLTRHSRGLVLFSAAPPGQGGEHHINEQPYDYWRELFRASGYFAVDCVRPRLAGDRSVSFWYRYNLMLYASAQMMADLPDQIRQCAVSDHESIKDIAPPLFRIRKYAIRRLPGSATRRLARIKAYFHS